MLTGDASVSDLAHTESIRLSLRWSNEGLGFVRPALSVEKER